MTHQSRIDWVALMPDVARLLLGEINENLSSETELRFGNHGSMSVDLKKGVWQDHETNEGGGVIDLIKRERPDEEPMQWLRSENLLNGASKAKRKKPKLGRMTAVYSYVDETNTTLFQVVRFDPKDFRQRRPDGNGGWIWNLKGARIVPYCLPELLKADSVFVCEGEKDANNVRKLGLTATTSPGGASKWRSEFNQYFAGKTVYILPDNDAAGRAHAMTVAGNLYTVAKEIRIVELPGLAEKADISDWLRAGGSKTALLKLIEATPKWKPQPAGFDGFASEDTVALEFAKQHAHDLRYDHDAGRWHRWVGTHWAPDRTCIAFTWARDLARVLIRNEEEFSRRAMSKASFAGGVERFARADVALAVTHEHWDCDSFLLGTPGGTVDLRTGQLRGAKPEDRITKVTACAPSERADCPLWLKFLREATRRNEALIIFLQRLSGYCLTGDIREHVLVFIFGPGGNGKSVFTNIITSVMGDYAITAAMDTFTASDYERHPTDLAMLRGARLVTAAETEKGRFWSEQRIKQLTGGDPITARFMRQDFFTYKPAFKPVIIGNHQPQLRNVIEALRRRIAIVPFINKPVEPDKELEFKLREEWPGILRWMIDGCIAWQKEGLPRPDVVQVATNEYFEEQDLFGDWVAERLEAIPVGVGQKHTLSAVLFYNWNEFARAAGEDPGTRKGFGEAMKLRGYERSKDRIGRRVWLRVRLRS